MKMNFTDFMAFKNAVLCHGLYFDNPKQQLNVKLNNRRNQKMTLVKWRRPFENGQVNRTNMYNTQLNNVFENLFGNDLLSREHAQFVPAVNLSEDEAHYHVELSAPGFDKGDFKIELNEGILRISGKHQAESEVKEKTYSRKEFNYGSFQRSFSLPEKVNEEAIDAKYENGILKVSLSKKAETKKTTKEILIS